ncbi:MAG: SpoIID/LytB domain-containing protein [Armatimonadota bacterium]
MPMKRMVYLLLAFLIAGPSYGGTLGEAVSALFAGSGLSYVIASGAEKEGALSGGSIDEALSAAKLRFRRDGDLYVIGEAGKSKPPTGFRVRCGLLRVGRPESASIACRGVEIEYGGYVLSFPKAESVSIRAGLDVWVDGVPVAGVPGPVRLSSKEFGIGARKYSGFLEVSGGKQLLFVNELPLEDYVAGVIPVEVPKSFQPEAQKALSVAIRTYAVKSVLSGKKHQGFDLCDNTDCQGFAGMADGWARELAASTWGEIDTYKDEPIWAAYSSDCGGVTAERKVFDYLCAVPDAPEDGDDYCAASPNHAWTKEFTPEELDRLAKGLKVGKFKSLEFTERDASERVTKVRVEGDSGSAEITGEKFRQTVGYAVIKSTLMSIDGSTVSGKGYGHGLGICQFGANGMAKSGAKYREILAHYYPGAELRIIDAERGGEGRPSRVYYK